MAAHESINPAQMQEHLDRAIKSVGGKLVDHPRGQWLEFPSKEGGRPERLGVGEIRHYDRYNDIDGYTGTVIELHGEGPLGRLEHWDYTPSGGYAGSELNIDHSTFHDDFPILQVHDSTEGNLTAERLREMINTSRETIERARESDSTATQGVYGAALADRSDPSKGMRTTTQSGIAKIYKHSGLKNGVFSEERQFQRNNKTGKYDPI